MNEKGQFNISDIMDAIIGVKKEEEDEDEKGNKENEENDLRYTIKIYLLKLLYNFLNNYHELQEFHFKDNKFNFISEFKKELFQKNEDNLNYYLLSIDKSFEKFKTCFEEFNEAVKEEFNIKLDKYKKYLSEENIDFFYSIAANRIIINNIYNNDTYIKFCDFCKNLFNDNTISEKLKNLIFLFFDENNFNYIIKPNILLNESKTEINFNKLEILLFGMRFCIQTIYNKNQNLYAQLLSDECLKKLKEYCLPGVDEPEDIKLINYYLLEEHFKKKPPITGRMYALVGFIMKYLLVDSQLILINA